MTNFAVDNAIITSFEMEKHNFVTIANLSRDDIAECVEDGFRHSVLLCMASSYDAGVFAPMADYIHHLQNLLKLHF